ncbi:adhesion G-protein coupled receptor D1-like [Montipora capricornis]|uniref:adhesion G-protein coupled receptor D1-like n=1 Tax=Montipora capricornis TaxID=246305 RepID=UPI0035F1F2F3
MLLEGLYLYIMVVEVFSSVKVLYRYVVAMGFPIIPVAISLGISSKDGGVLQNYTNENFCWLSFSKKLSWSFIVPVLIIILINVVILIAVLREIRNLKDPNPSKLRSFKKGFKACIILSPLLGLTWVFGLLAATNAGLVFQYIFTILNSAQGLFIFVLHVVRNSDVRAEIHHKLLRWRFQRSANRVHEKSSTSTCRCKQQQHGLEDCGNDTTVCQTSI